jgi:hypothetical protein
MECLKHKWVEINSVPESSEWRLFDIVHLLYAPVLNLAGLNTSSYKCAGIALL